MNLCLETKLALLLFFSGGFHLFKWFFKKIQIELNFVSENEILKVMLCCHRSRQAGKQASRQAGKQASRQKNNNKFNRRNMNLKDQAFLENTKKLVSEERVLLTKILQHLREIEAKRLFSVLKYSSLFEYCVKELGYSESQAQRRIETMRLVKQLPEIEHKIANGKISLSNAAAAQSFFRQERIITKTQKRMVMQKLEKQTTRAANQVFQSYSKTPEKYERRLEIKVNKELEAKIEKVKGLMAHKNPYGNLEQMFEELCDLYIEHKTPSNKQLKRKVKLDSLSAKRRMVWERAGNKCENCASEYALEIDHVRPKTLGGPDSLQNFRLLCRKCNQRAAIEQIGFKKMQNYLL